MINNLFRLLDQSMESQLSPFAQTTVKQETIKSESTDLTSTPLQATVVGEFIPLHIHNSSLKLNDSITITPQS